MFVIVPRSKHAISANGGPLTGKMFPEELKERYHAVATHVSNLISAQNRLLNPFNFSQDRVIVVVRSVAPTFTPSSLSLSALSSPCAALIQEKRVRRKKETRGRERGCDGGGTRMSVR